MKDLKNISIIALSLALIVALGLIWKKSEDRTVYVRTAELIDAYQGMIDARNKYASLESELQRSLDSLRLDLKSTYMAFEQTAAGLSELDRNKSIAILENKKMQCDQFEESMYNHLTERDAELTGAVIDQVNFHIKQYGEEHGYDMIIGTTVDGNVLFGTEDLDITDEVLISLNESYEGL
ncbi:OmpH family outer membrane protein [Sanyastnella coralliicola]|uniref:OmpH family outer membrane protein n=1 Tax=Sanyastnella coralliicola TaxID=3069118 RepID=UPI0027B98779|nr:OmpH family outer membrane protein [Longitalea sp. SCSIO 12813]